MRGKEAEQCWTNLRRGCPRLQTVEPRNSYTNRATSMLAAGAHFVQTSFPTSPTLFKSSYTVRMAAVHLLCATAALCRQPTPSKCNHDWNARPMLSAHAAEWVHECCAETCHPVHCKVHHLSFNYLGLQVALPIRGEAQQSTRCNVVTSGGVLYNTDILYTAGCPAVNELTPTLAPASSSSS